MENLRWTKNARSRYFQVTLLCRKVPCIEYDKFHRHVVQMGHKSLWWETVACPEDIEMGSEDEVLFRESMKEMASDSLTLLTSAWIHK